MNVQESDRTDKISMDYRHLVMTITVIPKEQVLMFLTMKAAIEQDEPKNRKFPFENLLCKAFRVRCMNYFCLPPISSDENGVLRSSPRFATFPYTGFCICPPKSYTGRNRFAYRKIRDNNKGPDRKFDKKALSSVRAAEETVFGRLKQ